MSTENHTISTTSYEMRQTITCILDNEPTCGTHKPSLVSNLGLITSSANVGATTIGCSATSIAPTSQLNHLGGDNLTLSGTHFPWNLPASIVSISFNDAQSTKCVPQTSTSTELVCLTSAFDAVNRVNGPVGLNIDING